VADETTPLGQAYQAYERLEGQLSTALDKLVATNGFADLLATSATNVMALTRLANGTVDKVVRSTRLAARRDVTELARQLARTEAKLERLLQAVEELQGQLEAGATEPAPAPASERSQGEVPSATTPAAGPDNGAVNGVSRARATRAAKSAPATRAPRVAKKAATRPETEAT
jgi:TolA-binding protein